MVLCWIALPVFAVLGLFSVRYRKLTKDSLECLFKTVTFRKCSSGLDDKIKSDISGTLLKYSPKAAKFTYNNYKLLSWIIVILFVWSAWVGGVGMVNYIQYGNCNGPEETGFCVFDPSGGGLSDIDTVTPSEIILPVLEDNDPIIGPADAELTIIEFGCYSCPYTKKAEPVIQEVIDHYDGRVNFQFKTLPIPRHEHTYHSSLAADCAAEQGKYKEYHDALFEQQDMLTNESFVGVLAGQVDLNITQFDECFTSGKYNDEIQADAEMGLNAGVLGTPTFFIGDQTIVGPKPFKTFKKLIDDELAK